MKLKEAKMYKLEAPKIGDEGISTVLKVLWKITTNSALRNRFSKNNAFFLRNLDRIGYGLYAGEKALNLTMINSPERDGSLCQRR